MSQDRVAAAAIRPPLVSVIACILCLALYVATIFHIQPTLDAVSNWHALNASNVGSQQFWLLLIPSAFLHSGMVHLLSNVVLFLPLGFSFESQLGPAATLVFIVVSAAISSTSQLLVGGHGDIGASGIVFALFGFLLVSRRVMAKFRRFLPRPLVWGLVGWFFYGIVATWLGWAYYGNAAHASGVIFGAALGWAYVWYQQRSVSAGMREPPANKSI